MNKGITFYFGFNFNPSERAKMIKDAGFDSVITNFDKKFYFQNGNIKSQLHDIDNNNLRHSSLHMRYNSNELFNFWEKGFKGFCLEKKLIHDIKDAYKYSFPTVVVHLKGRPNPIGLKRLKRILKVCNKYNIDIALENIEENSCLKYTFENLTHKHLKFCYDSGHHNVWDKDYDFLGKYGNKLVALHLHDNDGCHDDHTINKYGTIKWKNIAKSLAKLPQELSLDYEMLMYKKTEEQPKEILDTVFKQACELEKMIEDEKQKIFDKELNK